MHHDDWRRTYWSRQRQFTKILSKRTSVLSASLQGLLDNWITLIAQNPKEWWRRGDEVKLVFLHMEVKAGLLKGFLEEKRWRSVFRSWRRVMFDSVLSQKRGVLVGICRKAICNSFEEFVDISKVDPRKYKWFWIDEDTLVGSWCWNGDKPVLVFGDEEFSNEPDFVVAAKSGVEVVRAARKPVLKSWREASC